MSFVPLLDLAVTHTYYASGRCGDLALAPTRETKQLAKKHRAVWRSRVGGLTLIAPTNPDGRLTIPYDDASTLSFRLEIINAAFPLFTDLGQLTRQPAPLFTNAGEADASALSLASSVAWDAETLVVPESAARVAMVLGGRPRPGNGPDQFAVADTDAVRVSDYTAATRQLVVDTRQASPGLPFTVRYPVQPSLERGVFANVEIHTTGVLPSAGESVPNDPRHFRIAFGAKRMTWAYYVVTDLKPEVGVFRVVDGAREGAGLQFSPAHGTELGDATDETDAVAGELALRYPTLRRLRFVSDNPVPCRETARKNIALQLNGERVYSGLPNPSLHHYSTLELGDGPDAVRHDSLFEIVTHLTNRFPSNGA